MHHRSGTTKRAVRAAYGRVTQTTRDITPDFRAGAAALFRTGRGWIFCLSAEGPGAQRREVLLVFPDRRGRESAARAVILRRLSTGQATNRLCLYKK
ncbi:hypothetical protein GUO98_002820 [Salmonella enterica]|nr:hypothetical protein [Salmonella enterica]EEJ8659014.1 hypothetical protein [Salmonella enterica subsp. enterica]